MWGDRMNAITAQHLHRIQTQINWHGQPVRFTRRAANAYGEPAGTLAIILETEGLFHYSGGHLGVNPQEEGQLQAAKIPMVLIEFPQSADILTGDTATINGTPYTVTGLTDLGNEHIVLDISLRGEPDG